MQQKIIIGLVLTLIIVIFIPVYWAMEPRRQEAAFNRQQAEAVARGAKLYTSTCAVCHGSQGEGKIGSALKGTRLDADTLEKTIARGIPGTAMLAWGKEDKGPLNRQQIKNLVTFIKNWDSALTTTPAPTLPTTPSSPAPTPTAPAPVIDASNLYGTKCVACHGAKRQGVSGLGSALTPERLAALNDEKIRDTILNGRSGTAMPAFKGTLRPEEIDALLQFIKYTPP